MILRESASNWEVEPHGELKELREEDVVAEIHS